MPDTAQTPIDDLMEQASQALVRMDYAACERLAMQALSICQGQGDWAAYARVVMPLQEARRARRLAACDAGVFVGGLDQVPSSDGVWVAVNVSKDQAFAMDEQFRSSDKAGEVLWVTAGGSMDTQKSDGAWQVATFTGPDVRVDVPAPSPIQVGPNAGQPDAGWYLKAAEALGDAVLAACDQPLGSVDRVLNLQDRLPAVLDHEKLHQALAQAARQASHPRK